MTTSTSGRRSDCQRQLLLHRPRRNDLPDIDICEIVLAETFALPFLSFTFNSSCFTIVLFYDVCLQVAIENFYCDIELLGLAFDNLVSLRH